LGTTVPGQSIDQNLLGVKLKVPGRCRIRPGPRVAGSGGFPMAPPMWTSVQIADKKDPPAFHVALHLAF